MKNVLSESAVVRARYLPDVNGVNRYKYFHRPLIVDEVGVFGESIDSKKVPRRRVLKQHQLLPPIRHANVTRATATVTAEKNSAFTVTKSSGLSAKRRPNNDSSTAPTKAKAHESTQNQPQELLVTALNASTSSSTLPLIDSKDVELYVAKRLNSTWPNDRPPLNQRKNASCRSLDNGNSITKRTKSVSSLRTTESAFFGRNNKRPNSAWIDRLKSTAIKDFGTQTESLGVEPIVTMPIIVTPVPSIPSIEEKNNIPKATQTNNLPILTRLSIRPIETVNDIEQRSRLLEIVDEALDQTIDKNSRQRVNELIASSARKQAEVWRDAKAFVSTVLLPQSVSIANRARPSKSPIEAIANIHLP